MPFRRQLGNREKANKHAGQQRYSQEALARHAGFERSNYGAIERGEFNVRLDTILKVAAGLDMTVAALCEKANI
jgi:transcriptional regulator with XRE-family HTH domain